MNKIILLSDTTQLPMGAFDFACMLNEQQPVLLTGVFLPVIDYWNTGLYFAFGAAAPWIWYAPVIDVDVLVEEKAIEQFRALCLKNGIEHGVHEKKHEDLKKELKIESRFADMMLFSNEAFYENLDRVMADEYTDNTLHEAECPVMIVPKHFRQPERIILTYDGSDSSVYAIRQFAALMPDLAKLETLLVYVDPDEKRDFPEKDKLQELASRHYPNLTLLRLDIDPKKYFGTWLSERNNSLLVTGAQGRGALSELFHQSFIGEIVRGHMLPVFVAHR